MVSMMNVKEDTISNYGKHSQTALTACQLVSVFYHYNKMLVSKAVCLIVTLLVEKQQT